MLMNESENRIIDKIKKLLALSESDNEHEAKTAMLRAQEIMAKYKISEEQVGSSESKERPVIYLSAGPFRDEWVGMVASVIAGNFRCRCVTVASWKSDRTFRLRFYGYEEDTEICINIFHYAVKAVRKRFSVLRAIHKEAGREFGKSEKANYAIGFCHGLEKNFEEQKKTKPGFCHCSGCAKSG